MIKLIGLDIDGTIINDDTKISDEVKEVVAKVRKAGVHVALLSGRNYNGMKNYVEELNLKGIAASANGAEVVSIKDEKILLQEVIPYEIAKTVILDAKAYHLTSINFSNLEVYTEGLDHLPLEYRKILNQKFYTIHDIIENIKDQPSAKLMMVGKEKDLITLQILINNKFGEFLNADFSSNSLLEVYSNRADKGKALEFIRKTYDFTTEETMCIGDSENDIPMFKVAGTSIAMGNALEGVKEFATDITENINNHGAARAMEKYILDVR